MQSSHEKIFKQLREEGSVEIPRRIWPILIFLLVGYGIVWVCVKGRVIFVPLAILFMLYILANELTL